MVSRLLVGAWTMGQMQRRVEDFSLRSIVG